MTTALHFLSACQCRRNQLQVHSPTGNGPNIPASENIHLHWHILGLSCCPAKLTVLILSPCVAFPFSTYSSRVPFTDAQSCPPPHDLICKGHRELVIKGGKQLLLACLLQNIYLENLRLKNISCSTHPKLPFVILACSGQHMEIRVISCIGIPDPASKLMLQGENKEVC